MKQKLSLIVLAAIFLVMQTNAASHVTLSLQNATSTSNQIEFDIFIVNDGTTNLALGGYQFGVNFSNTIMNGGTPGAASFALIPGTRNPLFASLSNPSSAYNNSQLKSVATTLAPGVNMVFGTQYRLGRYRFTNTVNWTSGSVPNFQFQQLPQTGKTMALAQCFVNGASVSTSLRVDSTTLSTVSYINLLTLNVPLPVSLLHFRGEKAGPHHILNWTTGEERNNSYFNLQHSADGSHFTTIGRIDTKSDKGNSQQNIDYSFVHSSPVAGHNYYRLEQIDIDGNSTFTGNVIDLERAPDFSFECYPNPVTDNVYLRFNLEQQSNCTLRILDLNGRLLRTVSWIANNGNNTMNLDISALPSACYLLQFNCNGSQIYLRKFQKQ